MMRAFKEQDAHWIKSRGCKGRQGRAQSQACRSRSQSPATKWNLSCAPGSFQRICQAPTARNSVQSPPTLLWEVRPSAMVEKIMPGPQKEGRKTTAGGVEWVF